MNIFLFILKIIYLFMAVFATIVNSSHLIGILAKSNNAIVTAPMMIMQSVGITGFIALQWL